MGVTKSAIAQIRALNRPRLLVATAHDVATLYEACWWRTPPNAKPAYSERYAEKRGWAAPWRWDGIDIDDPAARPRSTIDAPDSVAIAAAIAGRAVHLTRTEQRIVIAELTRRGASAEATASVVGLSARTIERYRQRRAADAV